MSEHILRDFRDRLLQYLARSFPGGGSYRVTLHRLRGVHIGTNVWIGLDSILETGYPSLISIGDRVVIGMRVTIVAHFREVRGVAIKNDVYIGPGAIILPGVTIGEGSVIAAGTVVASSVAPRTLVQGNPGKAVARCGISIGPKTLSREFARNLKKL